MFFTSVISFLNCYYRTFYWKQCCKQHAVKLVRCVSDCLWLYFALNSLKMLNPKHSSFVCWTGTELSCPAFVVSTSWASAKPQRPIAPGKLPEAECRSTWRRARAGWRLQSSCCRTAPRWTPRRTMAGGLNAASRARNCQKKSNILRVDTRNLDYFSMLLYPSTT